MASYDVASNIWHPMTWRAMCARHYPAVTRQAGAGAYADLTLRPGDTAAYDEYYQSLKGGEKVEYEKRDTKRARAPDANAGAAADAAAARSSAAAASAAEREATATKAAADKASADAAKKQAASAAAADKTATDAAKRQAASAAAADKATADTAAAAKRQAAKAEAAAVEKAAKPAKMVADSTAAADKEVGTSEQCSPHHPLHSVSPRHPPIVHRCVLRHLPHSVPVLKTSSTAQCTGAC